MLFLSPQTGSQDNRMHHVSFLSWPLSPDLFASAGGGPSQSLGFENLGVMSCKSIAKATNNLILKGG